MKLLSKYLFAVAIILSVSTAVIPQTVNAFSVSSIVKDVKNWFGGGSDSEAAGSECMSKTIDELREAVHEASPNFKATVIPKERGKVHGQALTSYSNEDEMKQEYCAELLNDEGEEEDTTFSETFLWKPVSDSNGKAVALLPTSLMDKVAKVQLYKGAEPNITKVEAGVFSGNANGHRPHFRFSKPGSSFGGPAAVEATVAEGVWVWLIKNAGQRTEGVKGKFYSWADIAAAEAAKAAEENTTPSIGDFGNSCPAGFFDTNTNKSLKVMVMGDSNTKGSDASGNIGYRKAFKENMTTMGYMVDMVGSQSAGSGFSDNQHEGYPGEGLAKLQQVANGNSLTANNPDVILLLVGSNDMWISLDNRSPISDSAANSKVVALGNLIDTIHTKAPNALVIVAKPGTPLTGGWAAPRPLGIYSTGIDTIAITRSYVSVVDFTSFKGNGDGTHYNATGYGKIAETFAKKIDELKRKCEAEKTNADKTYSSKTSCESATGFVCKSENDKWIATTTKLASSPEELDITCKVSDTTPGVDDDVDIWLEVSGGKTPYDGKWSGDYKKANGFDKDSSDQTVSFDKSGNYKIKATVTDDNKDKASDTCPTIKVTDNGVDDDVVVKVDDNNNANNTQNNSATSNYPFYRDITIGVRGDDVTALQQFLVAQRFLVMPVGVAYGYFGELSRIALANWQSARGIIPSAGYFGAQTRAAIAGGYVAPTSSYVSPTQTYVAPTNTSVDQYYQSLNTVTAEDACINLTSTIYFGEENTNIGRVQKFLENGGYLVMPTGAGYGYYGKTTVTALSKFMAVRGITHNGAVMDSKVLSEVKTVSCK